MTRYISRFVLISTDPTFKRLNWLKRYMPSFYHTYIRLKKEVNTFKYILALQ